MKEYRVKKLTIFLAGCILLIACGQDDIGEDLDISIPVSIVEIKPGGIEEFVNTSGTVNAIKNVILRSEVEGIYRPAQNPRTGRVYTLGDQVTTGRTIIYLDNPEYENNIKIKSLKLNLDISRREFEKQKSLYDKGGVTLRELKNAERAFIDAQYAYDNAVIQLKKLKIIAPFDGIIIDMPYYTPGTKIDVNSLMVQLMDYTKLYADVYFPAKELNRVKTGQKIRATHYSIEEDTLWGSVTQVAPALDPQTRSFKSLITIDNPESLLRPGMYVKVETIVAQKDSVIVIPKNVILAKRQGKTVFVIDKGAAFERIITTGLENKEQVEVREGLAYGDRLVTKGFETLRNRSKIKIVQ
jgi:membrane fusion protein (multidrug efflux system)